MLDIGDITGKKFMASGRFIPCDSDPMAMIKWLWPEYAAGVDEVYGFAPEPLRLYGGRGPNMDDGLSDRQLATLRDHGIVFSMNLTNHHFNEEAYAEALPTLRRLHVDGNSIVCTNDTLAQRLRNDFPKYKIKASVLKHLNTKARIEAALQLYDSAVVPIYLTDNEEFLQSLEQKDRIVPWGAAWCAYTCRQWTCWHIASNKWMGVGEQRHAEPVERRCQDCRSKTVPMAFRLDLPRFAGYNRFKLAQPSARIQRVQ